jgi:hypothetical protein
MHGLLSIEPFLNILYKNVVAKVDPTVISSRHPFLLFNMVAPPTFHSGALVELSLQQYSISNAMSPHQSLFKMFRSHVKKVFSHFFLMVKYPAQDQKIKIMLFIALNVQYCIIKDKKFQPYTVHCTVGQKKLKTAWKHYTKLFNYLMNFFFYKKT